MMQLLSSLAPSALTSFLASIDTVLFDCDGVLYRGRQLLPETVEAVEAIKNKLGKRVGFVTSADRTRQGGAKELAEMGFPAEESNTFNPGFVAARYLQSIGFQDKKVYVFGPEEAVKELELCGFAAEYRKVDAMLEDWGADAIASIVAELDPSVGCVLVGSDPHLSYVKVMRACNYLSDEKCIFLALDEDAMFPIGEGRALPGGGPVVAAVRTSSGRQPIVCGKPNRVMFHAIRDVMEGITPERTLIVGDKCDSDILLGRRCGMRTLLVGTGVHGLKDVEQFQGQSGNDDIVPEFYADSLQQVYRAIQELK